MKRKISVAFLVISSGLMVVFAAEVDKCQEKFKACKETCINEQAQCKARGNEPASCERRLKACQADCDKALEKCQKK